MAQECYTYTQVARIHENVTLMHTRYQEPTSGIAVLLKLQRQQLVNKLSIRSEQSDGNANVSVNRARSLKNSFVRTRSMSMRLEADTPLSTISFAISSSVCALPHSGKTRVNSWSGGRVSKRSNKGSEVVCRGHEGVSEGDVSGCASSSMDLSVSKDE